MGTSYRVVARCAPALDGESVTAVLAEVNAALSNWDEDSEIARFHAVPAGTWVTLSPALADVMRAALELSAASDGAFDVTVGALVDAWGFGPRPSNERSADAEHTPAPGVVDAARRRVGHRFLEIDGRRLRRTAPVRIDLAAIGKGFGVDAVARALDAGACRDYLVEIGGEVRAGGDGPAGCPWRVAIESPASSDTAPARVIELRDAAIATSGDYRNFAMDGDVRRPHVIDPATGAPIRHGLASVSVLHPSAMWADGYATLLLVLGPERGPAWADAHGLAAYFVVRGEDGFEPHASRAMVERLSR